VGISTSTTRKTMSGRKPNLRLRRRISKEESIRGSSRKFASSVHLL
jgi:hypothetical protein